MLRSSKEKRLSSLAFAVAFALSVTACGTNDKQSRDSGQDAQDGQILADAADPTSDAGSDALADGGLVEGDAGARACADHHDCPQEWFCHRGTCRLEPLPVYHCGKSGCPPGQWCVEADGRRSTCAEDLRYVCDNACDCGPAHCCIDEDSDPSTPKRCVRDTEDPYLPGPATTGAGASCRVGNAVPVDERTPTYCKGDPACFGAMLPWLQDPDRSGAFLAYDTVDARADDSCGGVECFGSACDCAPGQQCLDFRRPQNPAGAVCGTVGGAMGCDNKLTTFAAVGICTANAIAESIFGWKPSDLLSCCKSGCAPESTCELTCEAGSICDLTWMRRGNRYDFERVTATCEPPESCRCGDGTCCPNELSECPGDCLPGQPRCGNAVCEVFENDSTCPQDCALDCGTGSCGTDESPENCEADCGDECGDGHCSVAEQEAVTPCASDCPTNRCTQVFLSPREYSVCGDGYCAGVLDLIPCLGSPYIESCLSCPQDCGACVGYMSCRLTFC